jgi:hypothetical protein
LGSAERDRLRWDRDCRVWDGRASRQRRGQRNGARRGGHTGGLRGQAGGRGAGLCDRGGARDRPHGLHARGALLDAHGRRGGHTLLEIGGALGRPSGPFAQPLELAGLGEDQQRQERYSGDRDERRERADLG